MGDLPTGKVTFLFADIEGSTRLWEEHPDAMRGALLQLHDLLRACIETHAGRVSKAAGDALYAAFLDARAALGDDAAFDAAWQEGRAMTLEQAIAYSLDKPKDP